MFSQRRNNKLITALIAMIATLLVSPLANAQKKAEAPAPQQSPDKLDVSDLEKHYWAAKDTDFSVVQNRTYTKEHRFSLTAQYGTLTNDAFNKGPVYDLAVNYYFTERHGIQLNYFTANLSDSKATENYKSLSNGVAPNHNRVTNYTGISYNWVPIYAKVSVLNQKIIYFDMAISPGIGIVNYDSVIDYSPSPGVQSPNVKQTATAFSLDVTQSFFVSRHLALRFDFKNKWFHEKILESSTASHGTQVSSGTNNTSSMMFGVQYFF
jgi:outer membrane beta-barrel protein